MLRNPFLAPALALAAVLAAVSQASAQPVSGPPAARSELNASGRIAAHVSALVLEDLKQFMPDETRRNSVFLRMVLLAKQEAIGASCAAYVVDSKRLAAVLMRTMRPVSEGAAKDVATANQARALRQYHTLLGGELAQFAADPVAYCASGKELVADLSAYPDAQSPLVLKPA
ncbi:MAG: hypothetical protein MUF47_01745 [Porphyrobacter sp.]|jgi:hypothetical protein|nr:hypothetical protein [Porphyrobacter sp.]